MSVFLSTPSARRATQGLEQYNRHNQNFYPRPLRGGRLLLVFEQAGLFVISIHALCEEGDPAQLSAMLSGGTDFYPRPLRGGRPFGYQEAWAEYRIFLSTPSARRATTRPHRTSVKHGYFYPRPLRGGRLRQAFQVQKYYEISIHALCEEGDDNRPKMNSNTNQISIHALCEEGDDKMGIAKQKAEAISIHALCEEGDAMEIVFDNIREKFLSTPSARRATTCGLTLWFLVRYFYPRPLRGGRHWLSSLSARRLRISIHALCEEGDGHSAPDGQRAALFLSTPSARRATRRCSGKSVLSRDFYPRPLRGGRHGLAILIDRVINISIHALCEEGDMRTVYRMQTTQTISIHALCEEGDKKLYGNDRDRYKFLSTPSARRATYRQEKAIASLIISIHALCEEGDGFVPFYR